MLWERKIAKGTVWLAACTLAACSSTKDGSSNLPSSSGSDRLTWKSESVSFTGANSGQSTGDNSSQAISVSLGLTLVASLAPPTVNGVSVYATDVKSSGSKIYVAYNTPGVNYGGAIDVIDITVPALPVLTSALTDATSDFSQVYISGSSLYSVGAKDTGLVDSAIIRKYGLNLGNLTSGSPLESILPGNTGLGVVADSSQVYAVSGKSGALSILSPTDLSTTTTVSLPAALDVRLSGSQVAVLSGKTVSVNPSVSLYSTSGSFVSNSSTLAGSQIDEAKATLNSGSLFHLATDSVGGASLVCLANGAISYRIVNPVVTGLTADQTAANAAVFANGLIYVANGGGGINVYSVAPNNTPADCSVTVAYVGNISFGDGTSVNNVLVKNGFLIAATGAGGFKIVTISLGATLGLLSAL